MKIGAFSYGASIVLYVISAQEIGATRGQVLFSTSTSWGVPVSFVFLGEPIALGVWIALGLVIAGILVMNLVNHNHLHMHEHERHKHARAADIQVPDAADQTEL